MNSPPPADPTRPRANRFVQVFDVSFVMILCFLTLLATMLFNGQVLVGSGATEGIDHSFHAPTFLLVAVLFALYLGYLLRHSERELRDIVHHVYGPPPAAAPPPAAVTGGKPASPQGGP